MIAPNLSSLPVEVRAMLARARKHGSTCEFILYIENGELKKTQDYTKRYERLYEEMPPEVVGNYTPSADPDAIVDDVMECLRAAQ